MIGERGLTLSGGQRQRLALARAMITDPRVLVLDDATSAVDPITEAAIHATLRRVTADRTTILIAHRRSTLALADRIAVVEQGRVVDIGTHEELLGRCARYRYLLGGDRRRPDAMRQPAASRTRRAAPDVAGGPVRPATRRRSGPDGVTPELLAATRPAGAGRPAADRSARLGRAAADRVAGAHGGGRWPDGRRRSPACWAPDRRRRNCWPRSTRCRRPTTSPSTSRRTPGRFCLGRTVRPVARTAARRARPGRCWTRSRTCCCPVLIRNGVDNGVSAGRDVGGVGGVRRRPGRRRGRLPDPALAEAGRGRAGENVLYQLRLREFAHLQRLGLDYYEREMAGRIMTRMTTDVDALSSFLQTGLVTAVVSLATFAGIAVVLVVMNVGLALVAFLALPFVAMPR